MKNIRINRIPLLILAVALATALSGCSEWPTWFDDDTDDQQLNLTFDKTGGLDGTWRGTVAGDLDGPLGTTLLSAQESGHVLLVEFEWKVVEQEDDPFAEDADVQFIAVLDGTLNTITGKVIMNGEVTEDRTGRGLLGAQVHEEGQLVETYEDGRTRYKGTIRIMAGSGGA